LVDGTPALVSKVVVGEAPVGIGFISAAEREKKRGSPVDWKPLPQIPILPLEVAVPANAAHPNVGRLFAAWLVTEAMPIQERMEFLSLITDPKSSDAQLLKQRAPDARVILPRDMKDIRTVSELSKRIRAIWLKQ
jgi:ABC-type Fe3+ transport system substrate-binding protein